MYINICSYIYMTTSSIHLSIYLYIHQNISIIIQIYQYMHSYINIYIYQYIMHSYINILCIVISIHHLSIYQYVFPGCRELTAGYIYIYIYIFPYFFDPEGLFPTGIPTVRQEEIRADYYTRQDLNSGPPPPELTL